MDAVTASEADAAALSTEPAPAATEAAVNADAPVASEAAAVPDDPQLQAINDQLQAARESPSNFSQWVSLVTATEKLGDITKLREVYDGFLAEFPLCYGYWKKYADAEHRHGMPEQAIVVLERGTAAVPYSVDLWGHFTSYKQSQNAAADEVRGLFEQGLAYVGTDYLSHGLWDKYISFELSQSATEKVARLYERVLASPIRELDRYHTSFKDYATQHPASTLLLPEEFSRISSALLSEKQAATAQAVATAEAAPRQSPPPASTPAVADTVEAASTSPGIMDADTAGAASSAVTEAPTSQGLPSAAPGDVPTQMDVDVAQPATSGDAPPGVAPDAEEAATDVQASTAAAVPVQVSDEDVKSSWIAGQEGVYQATKQEQGQRQPFETAIKRPYFHIKPLDATQLANWTRYLDYVETLNDPGATLRLYERCLVACASYADYWIRYVRHLEASGDVEGAQAALQRATLVHCKQQHAAHLFAALFEERHGSVDAARAAYTFVQGKLSPGLLAAIAQQANFERRQGAREAACSVYSSALESVSNEEGSSETYAFLAVQYSNFLYAAYEDAAAAREVYIAALSSHPKVKRLWEGAIHFEEGVLGPDRVQRVLSLYKRAVASQATKALSDADYEQLSARSVTFADTNADAATAEQTAAAHALLARSLSSEAAAAAAESKKRSADAGAAGAPASKHIKTQVPQQGSPAASSAAAAPATAAASYYAQPGYNYSGYYPSYPPAQQYPASYPPYAGYQ